MARSQAGIGELRRYSLVQLSGQHTTPLPDCSNALTVVPMPPGTTVIFCLIFAHMPAAGPLTGEAVQARPLQAH